MLEMGDGFPIQTPRVLYAKKIVNEWRMRWCPCVCICQAFVRSESICTKRVFSAALHFYHGAKILHILNLSRAFVMQAEWSTTALY